VDVDDFDGLGGYFQGVGMLKAGAPE